MNFHIMIISLNSRKDYDSKLKLFALASTHASGKCETSTGVYNKNIFNLI
jgi:hypothetical protein